MDILKMFADAYTTPFGQLILFVVGAPSMFLGALFLRAKLRGQ